MQYLNNVLEQDHRAIKRRVPASRHFAPSGELGGTIAGGYEAIHMIRKGQAYGSAAGARLVYSIASFWFVQRGDGLILRTTL